MKPTQTRFILIIAVLLAIAAGVIFLKLHNPLARPAPNNTRQVSIITASADTYVDSGMPSANFGKQEMFEVKGGVPESKALLHFDLKDLPAGAVIHSAMLELTPAQDLTSAGGYVMEVKGKWAENRVNANNAPLAGAIIATIPNPTRPGSPQSVEVTSAVQGSKGSVDFYITFSGIEGLKYYTREKGAAFAPHLIIEWSIYPDSIPTAAASG